MAKNQVVSGDYVGKSVNLSYGRVSIAHIIISKDSVESFEILDETQRKSASSAIMRAGAGALLLGPVGLAAGLSAKSKGSNLIALVFKNGKKSLIEVDNKIKKAIIASLF